MSKSIYAEGYSPKFVMLRNGLGEHCDQSQLIEQLQEIQDQVRDVSGPDRSIRVKAAPW